MVFEFDLMTDSSECFTNITPKVRQAITKSGISEGICVVFCPHTTAGITINENADPDVVGDMLCGFCRTFPKLKEYRHFEGNSTAHIKASCIGSSVTVIINDAQPLLGTWQGIYFCEFDGARRRKFFVKIM